jgi:phosphoribosyl-AMP cyclohydrolase
MALYTKHMDLGEAIAVPLVSDRPDGLFPTVVVDERGTALGLVYSSKESIKESVSTLRGVYHSRKRGLWRKGETSGDHQELLRIKVDCDRDAISFVVKQHGDGFCHLKTT